MQNLHDRALNLQNALRENAHSSATEQACQELGGTKFYAVALANKRTSYYVGQLKATKSQQLEALELALATEDAAKAAEPVVTTVEQLQALPPGTYTVAGKAAEHLAEQQFHAVMRQTAKDDEFVAACRLEASRARYEEDTKHRACKYRTEILQNFIKGRNRAELPMTNFNRALYVEVPKGHKARACVVKRLRRLVKIYNRLYK